MLLGSLVPIWLRAVVNSGDRFAFRIFVGENAGRILLAVTGVFVISPILSLDAVGLNQILALAGLPAKVASAAVVGFAISAFVMSKAKSKGE